MSICHIFPKFSWCCYCIGLRKGAIIITTLSLILSVLAVGSFTLVLSNIDEIDQVDFKENREFIFDLAVSMIVISCIVLILHIFMLIGVIKKKRSFLAISLWISIGLWIVSFIANFSMIFTGMEHFLFNRETGVTGVFANCKYIFFL